MLNPDRVQVQNRGQYDSRVQSGASQRDHDRERHAAGFEKPLGMCRLMDRSPMQETKAQGGFYLEDLFVDQTFEFGRHAITADEIKTFARQFDPQPFHIDEETAKGRFFGELVASGWHTAAITMRLLAESGFLADGFIGASANVRWPIATKPGDVLRVRGRIVEIKPSRSKPNRGMVTAHVETLNQNDDVAQSMVTTLVVHKRAPTG